MNWLGARVAAIIKEVEATTLLDVGCGLCTPTKDLKVPIKVVLDIYRNYLEDVRDYGIAICYDARRVNEIFVRKSFDIVLCLDVIEHLSHKEGFQLKHDLEQICKKLIIFYTPLGYMEQKLVNGKDAWGYKNAAQEHISGFYPRDFPGYNIETFHNGSNFLAWRRM